MIYPVVIIKEREAIIHIRCLPMFLLNLERKQIFPEITIIPATIHMRLLFLNKNIFPPTVMRTGFMMRKIIPGE